MSDAKQATPPAELERQICSATEPKNEREWWAHHEIARLQESNRLRAELLAAAKAELAALRAALAEADEPVAYLDEGLGVFYWPTEYEKLPHRDFVALFTYPPRREPLADLTKGATWEQQK